jgi:hypothetical protein
LIFGIGVPELAFRIFIMLSPMGNVTRTMDKAVNQGVVIFVVGPLISHLLGDDFSLPRGSIGGPTDLVPAAVVTTLLSLCSLLFSDKKKKDFKRE